MKQLFLALVILCTFYSLRAMDHSEPTGWYTDLADVPMAALLIPAAAPRTNPEINQPRSPISPGMLQVVYHTINNRPSRTK